MANPLQEFRKSNWKFQQTFATPLKHLDPFVAHIVAALHPVSKASLTIAAVVFEPKHLNEFAKSRALSVELTKGASIEVDGEAEAKALLHAALKDSIDFLWIPTPRRFAIYADHDEYTTFFAATKSNLNSVAHTLEQNGVRKIDGYLRQL